MRLLEALAQLPWMHRMLGAGRLARPLGNRGTWGFVLGVLSLNLALLLLRAWPRLVGPEVWAEDGTQNLPAFLSRGWSSMGEPVNGYLLLVPKLITALSASISLAHYPLVSTLLAWGVTSAALLVIAAAPCLLRGGLLLAAACLLVPSDPEVFGLPLYTFWWMSILLFVLVFWDPAGGRPKTRATILLLASLSSPVCIAVLPLLWIRSILLRAHPVERNLALLATACVGVQAWVMVKFPGEVASKFRIAEIGDVVPTFLGGYAVGNVAPHLQSVVALLLLAFVMMAVARDPGSLVKWGLVYLWCTAVFMTMIRVGTGVHQELAGPRYFFYPFLLLSWLFLQVAFTDPHRWMRVGAGAFLLLGLLNAGPVIGRRHDELNWRMHLESARHFDRYLVPVHYDGNAPFAWGFEVTRQDCVRALDRDPLYRRPPNPQTYPFRIRRIPTPGPADLTVSAGQVVNGTSWARSKTWPERGNGLIALGSQLRSGVERGAAVVRLNHGDRLLYRCGPLGRHQFIEVLGTSFRLGAPPLSGEWIQLEFSSDLLPKDFEVKFDDRGTGWDEWSAILLRDEDALR